MEEGETTVALRATIPQVQTSRALKILKGPPEGRSYQKTSLVEAVQELGQEVSMGRTSGQTGDGYMS